MRPIRITGTFTRYQEVEIRPDQLLTEVYTLCYEFVGLDPDINKTYCQEEGQWVVYDYGREPYSRTKVDLTEEQIAVIKTTDHLIEIFRSMRNKR